MEREYNMNRVGEFFWREAADRRITSRGPVVFFFPCHFVYLLSVTVAGSKSQK